MNDLKHMTQYRWHEILTALGVPAESLRNKHQPCPMCGGKDRFRYDDKDGNGTYICNQCGAGNGFQFVMAFCGYEFKDAVNAVKRILGLDHTNPLPTPRKPIIAQSDASKASFTENPVKPQDKQAKLLRLWQEALPLVEHDPVMNYLHQRGLVVNSPIQALRYHPALPYWQPSQDGKYQHLGDFPAMLGAISSHNGQLMGLHQTYLHQHNGSFHKLPEPFTAKKMQSRYTGALTGAAVYLAMPDTQGRLIVAEGIETALAAQELFGLPAIAALSAHGMKSLVLPTELTELFIVADHDTSGIGMNVAHALAIRAIKAGLKAHIWQSPTQGFDALDELNTRKGIQQ